MKVLNIIVVAAAVGLSAGGALAQQSPNGTPGAVPGVGPGGSGDQTGSTEPKKTGVQTTSPGSQSGSTMDPTNTTGQPAGDKPAQ